MFRPGLFIILFLALLVQFAFGQEGEKLTVHFVKTEASVLPGKVVNLAFRIENESGKTVEVIPEFSFPENWVQVTAPSNLKIGPNTKHLGLTSIKSPADNPVGEYKIQLILHHSETNAEVGRNTVTVRVLETEKINLQLVERPDHVMAGENIRASYLVQNLGNTEKRVYIKTSNCDVVGAPDLKLRPGESAIIEIKKITSTEDFESRNESYTVRVQLGDKILESVNSSTVVLPSKKASKDLFFRFPVNVSTTYLATNRNDRYQSASQFQIEGRGSLDPAGKHQLGFLFRGPDNSDLNFLGLYDQYYLYYNNKNFDVFLGDKSYMITPLTENARFGKGVEARVTLNNGLTFGATYLKPRFYEDIESEIAGTVGFNFNKSNALRFYYIQKKYQLQTDAARLFSITSELNPFERTRLELELSRGMYNSNNSNAVRAGINSQFSIFQVSGIYYDAGKFYPGYYTNARFYSANLNTHLTDRWSVSLNVREDYSNAQLDTFFVIAPYSKSWQGAINYRLGTESALKIYYRQNERKDRLSLDKFHYQTNSWNFQYNQRYKRLNYSLFGEIGKTTNFFLNQSGNEQNSYRASANINYRFNSLHSVRVFGTWSNINRFVSNDSQSLTAGIAATSTVTKNLKLNLYLQNAYDIDDYYRNRNLLQLNLDYTFLKKHKISLRSFYTLFRTEINNPEFTLAATYSYNIGIPLKQIISAGKVKGRISDTNGKAIEGIFLRILNETAVSDRNGEYDFKLIPPGRQLLTIDNSKLALDEITNIPNPLEVDVFENEETLVNIQILKGAWVNGRFLLGENKLSVLNNDDVKPENIVVELKTEFGTYRVTTNKEGEFGFPMIRPGEVILKIYENTVPGGYSAPQLNYTFKINPAEHKDLEIVLQSKKKNIIYKSPGNILSVGGKNNPLTATKNAGAEIKQPEPFYTVQIGAFIKALKKDARFLDGEPFYFEKQIDNLHKYFVGKFNTYEEANRERSRLKSKYSNAFIVVVSGDKILTVKEFEKSKQEK